MCWDVSTRRARLWRRQSRRREGLWKRRGLEKSKNRLPHPAWKSRKLRGIPTCPQPRRRQVKLLNRTFHVLQKADILTCYGHVKECATARQTSCLTAVLPRQSRNCKGFVKPDARRRDPELFCGEWNRRGWMRLRFRICRSCGKCFRMTSWGRRSAEECLARAMWCRRKE